MVAYSFAPRFIEPIRQGLKTQTIRAPGRRAHARPGQLLQLYSGMRTAHCIRILPDTPCLEVMPIIIEFGWENGLTSIVADVEDRALTYPGDGSYEIEGVFVDGMRVRDPDAFALRDGFADLGDMADFWLQTHGPLEIFRGVVIEWARPAEAGKAVAA